MGKFTYVKNPEEERDSFLDPIVHQAHIKLLSATVNKEGNREYVITLSDISQNLPETITILFIFDTQQHKIISVEKTTSSVESTILEDVEVYVSDVLGNDLDDICYSIDLKDHQITIEKEFDVLIEASGNIKYTDFDDNLPAQVEKNVEEE